RRTRSYTVRVALSAQRRSAPIPDGLPRIAPTPRARPSGSGGSGPARRGASPSIARAVVRPTGGGGPGPPGGPLRHARGGRDPARRDARVGLHGPSYRMAARAG